MPDNKHCRMISATKGYGCVADKINLVQPLLLLAVRLYIGYQAMVAGWAHLHHVDQTAEFFKSLNIPMPA